MQKKIRMAPERKLGKGAGGFSEFNENLFFPLSIFIFK